LRQAYDYWQDQPGNYRSSATAPHSTTFGINSLVPKEEQANAKA